VDHTELRDRRRIYLRAVIRSAGLESMAALAKKLDVTHSTLTNIQSAARSAGPDLIRKIERLAPKIEDGSILGARALSRGSDGDPERVLNIGERLKEAYRERLQELQSSEEMTSKNIREVVRNFDSMGSDDVFIFVSATQQPFEMNPNETTLKPAILNAIRRRSFFIYLRPAKELQGDAFFGPFRSRKKIMRWTFGAYPSRKCSLVCCTRFQVGYFLQ